MANQMTVAERIKELADERSISLYMLSYSSTVPLTTIINIVRGTTKNPGVYTILKICRGLDVSPAEFFDTPDFEELDIDDME